jgi:hypothetical protein
MQRRNVPMLLPLLVLLLAAAAVPATDAAAASVEVRMVIDGEMLMLYFNYVCPWLIGLE